ncbi:MerR family transcriptional regulator [Nocardia thailandica]|uniref:MerR family transcriptional regulator n=1 Tax=Nocardia thailandica TaxID=257275 RepID=UPI0002F43DEA|nr:MerR family transcriptional regulator [Nocardia thailandica]
MTATVAIGEFSRLTHLSVKTLRYYHELALLEPAAVDPATGYRRYSTDQVGRAHLIRRLRDLDMPLEQIAAVLRAEDTGARDETLRNHLARMEAELQRTRDVVASLRSLLTPAAPLRVDYRIETAFPAVLLTESVDRADIGDWCGVAFERLYTGLAAAGATPAGVAGATYSTEFFRSDGGLVTAYVPVATSTGVRVPDGLRLGELPTRRFAIAVHTGPFEDFDRTYGALGSHVAEHDTVLADEPVRERYLVGPDRTPDPTEYRTEVCWPITLRP